MNKMKRFAKTKAKASEALMATLENKTYSSITRQDRIYATLFSLSESV
jgi:hypothetical protein